MPPLARIMAGSYETVESPRATILFMRVGPIVDAVRIRCFRYAVARECDNALGYFILQIAQN